MDAIKKKMQAMKMEKDTAMDKADTCEAQAKDANLRADKVSKNKPCFNLKKIKKKNPSAETFMSIAIRWTQFYTIFNMICYLWMEQNS